MAALTYFHLEAQLLVVQNPDSEVAMVLVPLVVLEVATSYSLVDSPELGAVAMDLADLGLVAREH